MRCFASRVVRFEMQKNRLEPRENHRMPRARVLRRKGIDLARVLRSYRMNGYVLTKRVILDCGDPEPKARSTTEPAAAVRLGTSRLSRRRRMSSCSGASTPR